MELRQSLAILPDLVFLDSVDSTNLELGRRNSISALPSLSVLTAALQSAGQGRLGRTWVSEPETSLSVSLLLRSEHREHLAWATLMAAAAVRQIVAAQTQRSAKVKWPNDVLVDGRKISGILAQLQSDGSLILGVGINLATQVGAPDTATSLGELGGPKDFDSVLSHFLSAFLPRWGLFEANPLATVAKTREEIKQHSATLGLQVRAELPSGEQVIGLAKDIDDRGQLVLSTPEEIALSAADVWHLRN
ncbi:MAG: hypothetical protein RL696_147 [Actinomycetota bacterium]|jgi:BirA family biotin operon repressor/biotin-[acetyl-CoA-carboxylase] ligase